jgi:ABC-type multidrug transport system permease subunit
MNRILLIAKNDLRLFLKEKSSYFWLFGAPLLFAFFMGLNRGPGDPSNPRPPLLLENNDSGFMGKIFVEELGLQGFRAVDPKDAEGAQRGVRIPTNFTADILVRKPVRVEFFRRENSGGIDASMLTEVRLVRTLIAINSHLIEHSSETNALTEASLRRIMEQENPVKLEAIFGSRRPIPAGYNQSIPGVLVMFVLMNLLIFGGTSVASERREGVLRRFMVHPVTKTELVFGKIAGLLGLGLVQIVYMLIASMLFMKFRLGPQFLPALVVLLTYAWAAGSLGVLIGSIVSRDDKIVGICVLLSMVMAALGGCWWPLEIVPDKVRMFAHLVPPAWAMDALHQLISFGGSWLQIAPALLVLAAFATAANLLAIRFFRA